MPIFFVLVARRNVVLAEYTNRSGNFPIVTRMLLDKIPERDDRTSYSHDKYVPHSLSSFSLVFYCDVMNRFRFRIFPFLLPFFLLVSRIISCSRFSLCFIFDNLALRILRLRKLQFPFAVISSTSSWTNALLMSVWRTKGTRVEYRSCFWKLFAILSRQIMATEPTLPLRLL